MDPEESPKKDMTFDIRFLEVAGCSTKLNDWGGALVTGFVEGVFEELKYWTAAAIPSGIRTFWRIPPPAAMEPAAKLWNSGSAGIEDPA